MTFVRLRWALAGAALRHNPSQIVVLAIAAPVAAGVVLWLAFTVARARAQGPDARAFIVLGLSVTMASWLALTVVQAITTPALGPRSFATLPVPAGRVATGLLAAHLTGPAALGLAVLSLADVIMWTGHPATGIAALASAPLAWFTTVLVGCAVAQVMEGLLASPRAKAAGVLVAGLAPLVPVLLSNAVVGSTRVTGSAGTTAAARVAGWTPFGWAWSIPWAVDEGRAATAAVRAVAAVGFAAGLWWVWRRAVAHALVTPPVSSTRRLRGARGERRTGPGWQDTRVGTIAWRRLIMWRRDERSVAALLQVVVLPGFLLVQSSITHGRATAVLAVYLLATMPGTTLRGDLAYDGSAFALHLTTGVRGWQDRLGRVVAHLVVTGPLVVVLAGVVGWFIGGWWLVTLAVAVLPVTMGLGAWVGGIHPGAPPPRRGRQTVAAPGTTTTTLLAALAMTVAPLVGCLPVVLVLLLPGRWLPDDMPVHVVILLVAVAYGGAVLAAGVVFGGRQIDRRGPDLLSRLQAME